MHKYYMVYDESVARMFDDVADGRQRACLVVVTFQALIKELEQFAAWGIPLHNKRVYSVLLPKKPKRSKKDPVGQYYKTGLDGVMWSARSVSAYAVLNDAHITPRVL